MPIVQRAGLESGLPAYVTVERFRSDFPSLLYGARLSISQAGYNTVSDILQANCRSIVVPYSAGGETEQSDRATRLQQRGLASVLPEPLLSGEHLASLVRNVLENMSTTVAAQVQTDGANRTAQILKALVSSRQ